MIRRFVSYPRARAGLALVVLLVSIAGALVTCAPALADWTRPHVGQLTEVPNTAPVSGPFTSLAGVIVNPASGEADVANESVTDEFSTATPGSTGSFLSQVSGEFDAVDGATGDFYALGPGNTVDALDSAGVFVSALGGFESPGHVAVDQSTGDVYVVDLPLPYGGTVVRDTSSGNPANFEGAAGYISGNEITGTPSGSFAEHAGAEDISAIATDSHGNLYVLDGHVLYEYDSKGLFLQELRGVQGPDGLDGLLGSIAIDPTNGNILITAELNRSIAEFDPSGRYLDQIAGNGFVTDVAVSPTGYVYVADRANNVVDVYGPGAFLPDVAASDASERQSTSATLNGEVNPEGVALTDCRFEYVSDAAFKATGFSNLGPGAGGEEPCTPAAGSIPVDSSFHAVHANVAGLASGVTYHFRLVATSNPAELGGTADSAPSVFVTPHAPAVGATSASEVLSTFADLHAEIDPSGADTTYQFEYVDGASYDPGAQDPYVAGGVAPASPVDIGSAGVRESVAQQLAGLLPDTMYHFRAVATNALGVTFGPDQTFATLPVAMVGLPDGRAYELVTPPNKGDAEDMFGGVSAGGREAVTNNAGYASEDGNEFLLWTGAAFGPFPGSGENSYLFSRGADGWTYKSLAAPSLGVQSVSAYVYDPADFSQVGLDDYVGSTESQIEDLVGAPGGPYATLNSGQVNTPQSAELVGASANLSHVVLQTQDHALALGASTQDPGSDSLYEEAGGQLRLVNVNTNGSLVSRCGAVLGLDTGTGSTHNAVSSDGSKVFFTAPDPFATGFHCKNEGDAPQLYMRLDGEKTVEISAPETGVTDLDGIQPAAYVGASADGSKVFFMTQTELTSNDRDHAPELYEYDTVTSTLTRVSRGESGSAEGDVDFVPAISSDGSTVYFAAWGALASGATAFPSGSSEVNLYRYDTLTAATTFLTTVDSEDYPSTEASIWYSFPNVNEVGLDTSADWYTTPDGEFLVFGSRREITGYDPSPPPGAQECKDNHGGGPAGPCEELYRYDAATRSLICVSCDPNGAAPVANAEFARAAVDADNPAGTPPRPISENGEEVFFDTASPLVSTATNGEIDVYEWHAGAVSLISSGTDSHASFFLDASANGSNVFFGTHANLIPSQDTESEGNLYDARVCEPGDPCIQPPAGETAQCEGGTCQTPPPLPLDATPTSLAFAGPSNALIEPLAPPAKIAKKTTACKKGYVRKKVKKKETCIKKPTKKSKAKKSSKPKRGGKS